MSFLQPGAGHHPQQQIPREDLAANNTNGGVIRNPAAAIPQWPLDNQQHHQVIPPAHEDQLANQYTKTLNDLVALKIFLASAPVNWPANQIIKPFELPTEEVVSCICWNGVFYVTGTDIVRCLTYRFQAFGRQVRNKKKFEEGIFSDLRNLKCNSDAILEEPKSEFLDFLYKNNCVRTQKKQKVFHWFSVLHDRLFLDALERDLKKEAPGKKSSTEPVSEPAISFSLNHYNSSQTLHDQLNDIIDSIPKPLAAIADASTSSNLIAMPPPSAISQKNDIIYQNVPQNTTIYNNHNDGSSSSQPPPPPPQYYNNNNNIAQPPPPQQQFLPPHLPPQHYQDAGTTNPYLQPIVEEPVQIKTDIESDFPLDYIQSSSAPPFNSSAQYASGFQDFQPPPPPAPQYNSSGPLGSSYSMDDIEYFYQEPEHNSAANNRRAIDDEYYYEQLNNLHLKHQKDFRLNSNNKINRKSSHQNLNPMVSRSKVTKQQHYNPQPFYGSSNPVTPRPVIMEKSFMPTPSESGSEMSSFAGGGPSEHFEMRRKYMNHHQHHNQHQQDFDLYSNHQGYPSTLDVDEWY